MTAQIGDSFKILGDEYTIVEIDPYIDFYPGVYGINPKMACTACWNGYWCVYDITDEGIFVDELYVHSSDGSYPDIEGVSPMVDDGTGDLKSYMGHRIYKGLNIKMDYSGRILVGADFLSEYYIHTGYQSFWAYGKLLELVFDDGKLAETIDRSEDAAYARKLYDTDRNAFFRFLDEQ